MNKQPGLSNVSHVGYLTHFDWLPDDSYRFLAVRVKVRVFGASPARAFGLED